MQSIYVFADFELDGLRFELRQRGERVTIQPKELRLVLYLVAHRDRAVANSELLAALWPGENVCRGSLKRAVRGARRALGDDGERQSRIRTVRGYGYEFVESVALAGGDLRVGQGEAPPYQTRGRRAHPSLALDDAVSARDALLRDALARGGELARVS